MTKLFLKPYPMDEYLMKSEVAGKMLSDREQRSIP
jgi:hypothetical protein